MFPLVKTGALALATRRETSCWNSLTGCSATVNVPESSSNEGGCRVGTTQSLVPFVGPPSSPIQHAPEGWYWPSGSPRREGGGGGRTGRLKKARYLYLIVAMEVFDPFICRKTFALIFIDGLILIPIGTNMISSVMFHRRREIELLELNISSN